MILYLSALIGVLVMKIGICYFQQRRLRIWIFFGSDHIPIYINLRKICNINFTKFPRRFTFEHKWLLEDDFADYFQRRWEGLEVSGSLPTKLLHCRSDLSDWAGNRFNQLGKNQTSTKSAKLFNVQSSC